jgi:N,N'-diacetylchitobiose phosphorylase
MRYGRFDDERREYVIERPDTPMPWINYLGEGDYCSIISNNAGGYGFRKSPGLGRLLRYRFNAVPCDRPGRYIYLREADGDFWSVSWAPVQKPLDKQRVTCRHGLGYTVIDSEYRGIASDVLFLVPPNELLETWCLNLTNRTAEPRTLDVFAYAEFAIPEFARETDLQCMLYAMFTSFKEGMVALHMNRAAEHSQDAYFACGTPVESFDAQREAFIGPWRDEASPLAVARGRCSDAFGNGDNGCGALQLKVTLAPGKNWSTVFLLGSGKAESDGARARATYTVQRITEEWQALKARWQERLQALSCRAPDAGLNSMVNVWSAYQAHVTFKWSRSASFVEAGGRDGFGYRDTLQDALAVMHTSAPAARERIVDLLRGQCQAGSTLHAVQPLTLVTGQGQVPEKAWSDDHLWILLAVGAYLRETGDLGFLERRVAWLDKGEGTVHEHGRQALEFARGQTGRNDLLLGLCADWNDSLNLRLQRGESVFTSMLYCAALLEFARWAEATNRPEEAREARRRRAAMAALINERAWDGEWYMRAFHGDGRPIGSKANRHGRIFVESNAWAVLSGVADAERGRLAMDSLRAHLATPYGMLLCNPPYPEADDSIGGMTYFPPGQKENAAVFCHAHTWAIAAEAVLGRGERAMEYYEALRPGAMNEHAEIRQVEPYVYCQFVKGPSDSGFGQGRNPWLTGTAAWAYLAATQHILGVRPSLVGLILDPCIPAAWEGFSVKRLFRGATYSIHVRNPKHVCAGVRQLSVDGRAVQGNVVPVAPAGGRVEVEVELGG